MHERRVVITGIGAVSPLGNDLATTWQALKAGKSGIAKIESIDTSNYKCHIAGEVKNLDATPYFNDPKDAKRVDRYTHLAMAAAKMAVEDSGIEQSDSNKDRIGVIVGSGIGGLDTLERNHKILVEKGPRRVSPFVIPMMIPNIATGMISMEYGYRGPNMAIVTACATANNSIGESWRMIKFGDADACISGGAEGSIFPMGVVGFSNMHALSSRNDDPTRASRPFDQDRDGFVMGEGAGVVVLEEYEHAKKRGATIYAELIGYGTSADAYHLTSPHPEGDGAALCMQRAIDYAKINPSDVDYINAHGTSTPLGDVCETKAIKQVFGEHAKTTLSVSSTKSMTGHLLGAAGGIELAACLMAMQENIIPPTINLDNQDAECDLDYTAHQAKEKELNYVLSNSFGFGGHNASLLLKKI